MSNSNKKKMTIETTSVRNAIPLVFIPLSGRQAISIYQELAVPTGNEETALSQQIKGIGDVLNEWKKPQKRSRQTE